MSVNELEKRIEKMQEWEALAEEARAEAEALRDEIKAEMQERDTEELAAGRYIVRWTSVLSNRFDTTAPCLTADQSNRQETSTQTTQERAQSLYSALSKKERIICNERTDKL